MKIQMKNATEKITLKQAFEGFTRKCQLRNLSKETISYYKESFIYLSKVIPPDSGIESLSEDSIDNLVFLLKQTMEDTSVNTRLRGIRTFINYCFDLGYVKPFKLILLKTDEAIKETYTTEELKTLLKKPDVKKCIFAEFRTWTAINILIGTGCRVGSLLQLQIKDLLFDDMLIKFTKTKGRKQLIVPMSKTLCDVLQDYLQYRGNNPDDYVICNQWGKQIQRNGLLHAISKYNQKRGVMKTSCHLFRHTFAKVWVQNHGDIFRLQKILGHEDIKITQQYLKDFGNNDLNDSFERFNALETIAKQNNNRCLSLR